VLFYWHTTFLASKISGFSAPSVYHLKTMQVFELKHQLSIYLMSVLITGLYRPLDGLTYLKYKLLCFLTHNKLIFKRKVLAFNLDRCCHLALCLQLILFHSTKEGCSHCCNCQARQATKNLDKQVCEQISVFNDWHNGGRNGRQGEQKQNKKSWFNFEKIFWLFGSTLLSSSTPQHST